MFYSSNPLPIHLNNLKDVTHTGNNSFLNNTDPRLGRRILGSQRQVQASWTGLCIHIAAQRLGEEREEMQPVADHGFAFPFRLCLRGEGRHAAFSFFSWSLWQEPLDVRNHLGSFPGKFPQKLPAAKCGNLQCHVPDTNEQGEGSEAPGGSWITRSSFPDGCLTQGCPPSPLRELGRASLYGKTSAQGKIICLASVTDLMPSHWSSLLHLPLECHI